MVFIKSVFSIILFKFAASSFESDSLVKISEIYNKHGVGNGRSVCDKIDDKTSRIFGEALCVPGADKLFGKKNQHIFTDVTCGIVSILEFSKFPAVICTVRHQTKPVVIINGPEEPYYYIATKYEPFVPNKIKSQTNETQNSNKKVDLNVTLMHCIYYRINELKYFREPDFEKNREGRMADHVFRIHPPLNLMTNNNEINENHVCAKKKNSDILIGSDICVQVRSYLRVNTKLEHTPERADCGLVKLAGYFNPISFPEKYSTIVDTLMIRCWYGDHSENRFIGVVNTTKPGVYYIARKFQKGIFRINNVLHLKI